MRLTYGARPKESRNKLRAATACITEVASANAMAAEMAAVWSVVREVRAGRRGNRSLCVGIPAWVRFRLPSSETTESQSGGPGRSTCKRSWAMAVAITLRSDIGAPAAHSLHTISIERTNCMHGTARSFIVSFIHSFAPDLAGWLVGGKESDKKVTLFSQS